MHTTPDDASVPQSTAAQPRAPGEAAARTTVPLAGLWASAAVIAALIIVQAGRMTGSEAYAGLVLQGDQYTLLTSRSGSSEDVAVVIDHRSEEIFVYQHRGSGSGGIDLLTRANVGDLFGQARQIFGGRP